MKQLGWTDNAPTNITDHKNQTRNLDDWREFVYDGIKRARQQSLDKCAKNRPNYTGVDRGVDEHTTRKFYQKLMGYGHREGRTNDRTTAMEI
eukprot:12786273-Heterocapsa_arctica.AAC.1